MNQFSLIISADFIISTVQSIELYSFLTVCTSMLFFAFKIKQTFVYTNHLFNIIIASLTHIFSFNHTNQSITNYK